MGVVNRNNQPEKTSQTEQYVLNYSFDEIFKLLMVGLAGYNSATNSMDRVQLGTDGGLKVSDVTTTTRYDLQSPVYYVGSAPIGADETASVWNVTKYDLTTNPYAGKIATNTSWTGRIGATYA